MQELSCSILLRGEKKISTNTTTHDNGNTNIVIPRTDGFMEKVNARMKFFLGDNACVGKDYSGGRQSVGSTMTAYSLVTWICLQ